MANKNISVRNLSRHKYPRQRIIVFTAMLAQDKWRVYICNAETKTILQRGPFGNSEDNALDVLLLTMRNVVKAKRKQFDM